MKTLTIDENKYQVSDEVAELIMLVSVERDELKERLSAREALFGFCGWLTSRQGRTIMSSKDDAAPIADLIEQFCKTNNLPECRENWSDFLTHPSSDKCEHGELKTGYCQPCGRINSA